MVKLQQVAMIASGLALVASFGLTSAGEAVAAAPQATQGDGASSSPVDGNWDGTYSCGAHPDGLHLQIRGSSSSLTAVFVFYPLPSDPGGFGPGSSHRPAHRVRILDHAEPQRVDYQSWG